jgi:Zn-dependent peptidase ImmA (M78 family)
MPNTTPQPEPSVLATLRRLNPHRPLQLNEALWLAELQANRLLQLRGVSADVPIPTTIVTELPRIAVEHDPDLPATAASGCSDWDYQRRTWVISLNPTEPRKRRRFTVLHEYKHILDHGSPGILPGRYPASYQRPAEEIVADYFAGCVLIPKRLLTAAYYDGIQDPADLAQLFDVSKEAIEVRLAQVGLAELVSPPGHRHAIRPYAARSARYYRTKQSRPMEVAA